MQNNLLILFGGSSEERLVSVASAQNLIGQLAEADLWFISPRGDIHQVSRTELQSHQNPFTVQFVPKDKSFAGSLAVAVELMKNKIVIVAMHGTEGEDGTLQALLEKNKIAFTGSGSTSSKKCFDKKLTKTLAGSIGLPIAADLLVKDPTNASDILALREFQAKHGHMVLKPVANGSSVGLFIIKNSADLESAIHSLKTSTAGAYLAESFLEGREITVGVCQTTNGGNRVLPCSEVRVIKGRQFDYEGKYLGKGVEELTPAPLNSEETRQCQAVALKIHELMGCEGYSRTDMILTSRGPVMLEINTLPGLSRASFIPQQVIANGENLRDFFQHQAELAQARNAGKKL